MRRLIIIEMVIDILWLHNELYTKLDCYYYGPFFMVSSQSEYDRQIKEGRKKNIEIKRIDEWRGQLLPVL